MKAITLHQPWAGLLVLGMKQFETRSWDTKHRGLIAVHASAKIPKDGQELIEILKINFISRFSEGSPALSLITKTGAVLGEVDIVETYSTNFDELPQDYWEKQFGDYTANRRFWECKKQEIYAKAIPAKGQLLIWNWEKPSNL